MLAFAAGSAGIAGSGSIRLPGRLWAGLQQGLLEAVGEVVDPRMAGAIVDVGMALVV